MQGDVVRLQQLSQLAANVPAKANPVIIMRDLSARVLLQLLLHARDPAKQTLPSRKVEGRTLLGRKIFWQKGDAARLTF